MADEYTCAHRGRTIQGTERDERAKKGRGGGRGGGYLGNVRNPLRKHVNWNVVAILKSELVSL